MYTFHPPPIHYGPPCLWGAQNDVCKTVGTTPAHNCGNLITASTAIIDVRGTEPVRSQGAVPAGAVVIPGTRKKQFPAGEYDLPCALIIGERSESTDKKTSLNDTLRTFAL